MSEESQEFDNDLRETIKLRKCYIKLPTSSNKDIPENNQVGDEWRNLNEKEVGVIPTNIRSLSVEKQVKVSPVGSYLKSEMGDI